MYVYSAQLIRVIDGDTWVVDIDLGLSIVVRERRIRAARLNAPEMSTAEGKAARDWVIAWFAQHCPDGSLTLRTQMDRNDDYGRLLGTVMASDGACLNADLLASGNAVVWPAPKSGV